VAEARECHQVVHDEPDPLGALGRVQPQPRERPLEAFQVIVQAEKGAVPGRDRLLAGVGAQEAPVEQRDACLLDRAEVPFDIRRARAEAGVERPVGKVGLRLRPDKRTALSEVRHGILEVSLSTAPGRRHRGGTPLSGVPLPWRVDGEYHPGGAGSRCGCDKGEEGFRSAMPLIGLRWRRRERAEGEVRADLGIHLQAFVRDAHSFSFLRIGMKIIGRNGLIKLSIVKIIVKNCHKKMYGFANYGAHEKFKVHIRLYYTADYF
jgi:hypothetical protein